MENKFPWNRAPHQKRRKNPFHQSNVAYFLMIKCGQRPCSRVRATISSREIKCQRQVDCENYAPLKMSDVLRNEWHLCHGNKRCCNKNLLRWRCAWTDLNINDMFNSVSRKIISDLEHSFEEAYCGNNCCHYSLLPRLERISDISRRTPMERRKSILPSEERKLKRLR